MNKLRPFCAWGACLYFGGSCFMNHVVTVAACDGESMLPSINDGDWVLVHRFVNDVKKNDVVLLRDPQEPREFLVKRVMKLEGENIANMKDMKPWVPRGHIWIEGDNKEKSLDSRDHGPIPLGLVLGKVFLKFWPIRNCGFIPSPSIRSEELISDSDETDLRLEQ